MSILRHYFAEGKFLGTSPGKEVRYGGGYAIPMSRAYFCPVCAEVWARIVVESSGETQLFHVFPRNCRKHPPSNYISLFMIPGSVVDSLGGEAIPDCSVYWELDRLMDWYEWAISQSKE